MPVTTPSLTPAAVAVCIVPDGQGQACFVLTQRAAGLRAHARQWALPGGRTDQGETAVEAALREAEEEVGLRATARDVLGVLDDYPTRSGYVMTPVVLWCQPGAPLVPNAREVASVHIIPLDELEHPDAPRLVAVAGSDAPLIQMPVNGDWIHAPTAAILLQLREVALHGRPARVSHFAQPRFAWR